MGSKFPQDYIHYSEQVTDTGLKLNLLQKYVFIPLDIFRERKQNNIIRNQLEAWLTFLSAEEPEEILRLLESYPEYKELYGQVYDMCRNLGEIMGLFSEELLMMDRNTVQLMIDEMQEELNRQKDELASQKSILERKDSELEKALQRIKELEMRESSEDSVL